MKPITAYRASLIIFIAGTLYLLGSGYKNCNDQGGDYVRGLFWMECLGVGEFIEHKPMIEGVGK